MNKILACFIILIAVVIFGLSGCATFGVKPDFTKTEAIMMTPAAIRYSDDCPDGRICVTSEGYLQITASTIDAVDTEFIIWSAEDSNGDIVAMRTVECSDITDTQQECISHYWEMADTPGTLTEVTDYTIVTPQALSVTTEDDVTVATELTSSVVMLTGDNDADHDTLTLQDGIISGTFLTFIVAATCDDSDTLIIDAETDSTCTGCPTSGIFTFDDPGDKVTLFWSGTAWFYIDSYAVD